MKNEVILAKLKKLKREVLSKTIEAFELIKLYEDGVYIEDITSPKINVYIKPMEINLGYLGATTTALTDIITRIEDDNKFKTEFK